MFKAFDRRFCRHKSFEAAILALVILNAICLGVEVSLKEGSPAGDWFRWLDRGFLGLFTVEILVKINAYRRTFFKDPWRVFDFIVVTLSLIPAAGPFSILRALRILRTIRLISVVPKLRQVVVGLMSSIPGLGAVGGILILIFYVGSVMATAIFGDGFPDWFGTLPKSAYSLFQVMTLESWSMGIVRPVMERYPYAWLFFVPFIIISTFIMLNLMIAVIVNSLQIESSEAARKQAEIGTSERLILLKEIRKLQIQIDRLDGRAPTLPQNDQPISHKPEFN